MTHDMSDHLRKISSRNGRYWLRDIHKDAESPGESHEELPFRSLHSEQIPKFAKAPLHEIVVVSIPDMAVRNMTAPAAKLGYLLGENTRVVAPLPKVEQTPPAAHSLPETIAQQRTVSFAPAAPAIQKHAALSQPSAEPIEAPIAASVPIPMAASEASRVNGGSSDELGVDTQQDDAVEAARASQSKETKDSIGKIADEIVKRFPVASPSVIMFAGSQASLHTDESCARVAAELAGRNLGRVLLIDSDFSDRRLTKASGMSQQGGLSEVMNIAFPWQQAVLKSGSSKLDFMPAGNCPHKRWIPKEQLREALAESKSCYQFICVSVGDAHDAAASTWSELADGAFLLVSATHSSDSVAESAVTQLRSDGARLVGCIVADVDAEVSK